MAVATLTSCYTTKTERQAERVFKGAWTLTSITYPNSSTFVESTLFRDATAKCFENSNWNFVPNNNQGNYSLTGAGCDDTPRSIVWSVQEVDASTGLYSFLLKVVAEGENARKVDTGFRVQLASLTETTMSWEQTAYYEGEPIIIRMNFTKL